MVSQPCLTSSKQLVFLKVFAVLAHTSLSNPKSIIANKYKTVIDMVTANIRCVCVEEEGRILHARLPEGCVPLLLI